MLYLIYVSFGDENEKLIDMVLEKHPSCESLEMEVFDYVFIFIFLVWNAITSCTSGKLCYEKC